MGKLRRDKSIGKKTNIQEWYDKSVRPPPQYGKSNRPQAGLAYVPKDIYNSLRHQEQRIKGCCDYSNKRIRKYTSQQTKQQS